VISVKSEVSELLSKAATGFNPRSDDLDDALRSVTERANAQEAGIRTMDSTLVDDHRNGSRHAPSRRRRVVTTLLVAAASFVMGGIAVAQTQPSEAELAEQYGLQSHPWNTGDVGTVTRDGLAINGTVLDDPNCQSVDESKITVVQEVGDHFYCIVADTRVDAWVIGQQLLGKSPTQQEIEEMRSALGE
jgi:hypothetical protein